MNELSLAQQKFLLTQKRHKRTVTVSRLCIFILFLALWEGAAQSGLLDSFIFSSPSKVLLCAYGMALDQTLFAHIGITLFETIASFLLVLISALVITIILWLNKGLSETLEPYLVILNSLPKSALAPLLIVWLGATYNTIIITGVSVAIFGSILSLYTSFTIVDPGKIKLIYTLGGNRFHALSKVVLPSSIPAIISNMKVNIGLCLVGVIIGEFLAARDGLGYLIIYSSQVFRQEGILI